MNKRRKFYIVNILIIFSLIILPLSVLASLPTTTDFDRHNVYPTDGFRAGGYYAVRSNSTFNGTMNMTHTGGTREFNIETYNIENLTLDFDLMFERRSYLFGWGDVTWEDAVDSLGNDIYINITTDGNLENLRFVDQPNVWIKVWKNGTEYLGWQHLEDLEVDTNGLDSGNHTIRLQFEDSMTIEDILIWLLQIIIIFGLFVLLIRYIRAGIFGEEDYYTSFWSE